MEYDEDDIASVAVSSDIPPNILASIVDLQHPRWLGILASVSRESRRLVKARCVLESRPFGIVDVPALCTHLPLLQWAIRLGCPLDGRTAAAAAKMGNLQALEWLKSEGCPWDWRACCTAAINGDVRVLQWLKREGCPWNELTCWGAAVGGHLDVLQWARGFGCPWDDGTCVAAARGGHLFLLQWAAAHGCPFRIQECLEMALKFQKYHVAAWIELGALCD